jgi:hypothetical protein
MRTHRILTLLWSSWILLQALAEPAHAVLFAGRTDATFTWTAASGDVYGYFVYVARNGEPLPGDLEAWTPAEVRQITIDAVVPESIVVTVAAFDARYRPGPRSRPSERVHFLGCEYAAWASGLDADEDGVIDACDNCPYTANPDQSDVGGLGQGVPPDGIGDECQCGDVSGDGTITNLDHQLIYLAHFERNPARIRRWDLCDVGDTLGCTMLDGFIVQWASEGITTIVPQCPAAQP